MCKRHGIPASRALLSCDYHHVTAHCLQVRTLHLVGSFGCGSTNCQPTQLLVQLVRIFLHPALTLFIVDISPSGDSYTQTGFNVNSTLPNTSNPLGNPAFPGWTAVGGANWVGYVTTTYNRSLIYTYNYAYGGATIDAKLVTPYQPTVQSLTDQVNSFLSTAAKKPASTPWTSGNALFSVWIGINDIGNSWYLDGDRGA